MISQILSDAQVSEIDIHADADWAGCPESRRSTSGFCLFVSGNLIHSASRAQGSIAMSSAESEPYTLCTATSEGIFLRNLMYEAGMSRGKVRLNIFTDSSAAKSIVSRIGPGKRSKHIHMKYLLMQELNIDGQIKMHIVSSMMNTADLVTKYLTGDPTQRLSRMLRLQAIHSDHQL